MSRLSRSPVNVPTGVDVTIDGQHVHVKGSKGVLEHDAHPSVRLSRDDGSLMFRPADGADNAEALTGTTRSLVNNMIVGVSNGFRKRLQLIGVGYRAQMQGTKLNLALGFSHPVDFVIPDGITIETPSNTEIIVSGIDKQKVGQTAAVIRAYRPPEPYKGKGVRYFDEDVVRKEAKKK